MNKVYEEYCETIDGVKGQWLTVKESNKVSSGQRVRYSGKCVRFGYTECETVVVQDDGNVSVYWGDERVDSDLFSGYWKNIQAWFPFITSRA